MTHTLKVGCYGAKGSYTYEAMEQQFVGKERKNPISLYLKMS